MVGTVQIRVTCRPLDNYGKMWMSTYQNVMLIGLKIYKNVIGKEQILVLTTELNNKNGLKWEKWNQMDFYLVDKSIADGWLIGVNNGEVKLFKILLNNSIS